MPEHEKQTNRERLKDITDSIETGIKELFESDKYRQYKQFGRHSNPDQYAAKRRDATEQTARNSR